MDLNIRKMTNHPPSPELFSYKQSDFMIIHFYLITHVLSQVIEGHQIKIQPKSSNENDLPKSYIKTAIRGSHAMFTKSQLLTRIQGSFN